MENYKDLTRALYYIKQTVTFNRVLKKVKVLSVENGKCTTELKVDTEHINGSGHMHTGFSVTLVDVVSAFALKTLTPKNHLSVDIHFRCMETIYKGDCLLMDAYVRKMEDNKALLEVIMKNKKSGQVVGKGTHTTFII